MTVLICVSRKLQLASYEWVEIGEDPAQFDEKFGTVLKYLKEELLRQESGPESQSAKEKKEEKEPTPGPKSNKSKGN